MFQLCNLASLRSTNGFRDFFSDLNLWACNLCVYGLLITAISKLACVCIDYYGAVPVSVLHEELVDYKVAAVMPWPHFTYKGLQPFLVDILHDRLCRMADGSASGKGHPVAGHEECYVIPEMVSIAILPIPEWHGVCPHLRPHLFT